MSKELNILQAIEMPVETEFNVVYKNGIKSPIKTVLDKNRDFVIGIGEESESATHDFITAKFIPIQKPVSFMEAVKSNKKIRVDLSELDGINNLSGLIKEFKQSYYLDEILNRLSQYNSGFCSEAINKGKWYIEEE